jgi:hypothetical protein
MHIRNCPTATRSNTTGSTGAPDCAASHPAHSFIRASLPPIEAVIVGGSNPAVTTPKKAHRFRVSSSEFGLIVCMSG